MSGHCRTVLYAAAALSWVALVIEAINAYADMDIGRVDLLVLILMSSVAVALTLSAVIVGVICPVVVAFELGRRIERAASHREHEIAVGRRLHLVDDKSTG